jgi:hypothetical protein
MANYDPNSQEILGLQEQKALAKALMEHGMSQNLQGQMVSGRYVGASPWEGIAKLANIYVGSKLREQAGQKELDLAEMLRTKGAEATQDYIKALQGTPEQEGGIQGPNGMTTQTTPDMYNADMSLNPQYKQIAPVAAKGPDYGAAFRAATSRYAPAALQSAGYELLKPIKTAEGETVTQHNFAPGGGFTTLATGGEKNPNEIKSAVAILGLPKDSSKWTAQDRSAIDDQVFKMKRANANQNTINMPPVESAYNAAFGKGVAEQDLALKGIAESAKSTVANISNQRKILETGNFFTGPLANTQQAIATYGNALGVAGKNAQEKVANTQSLIGGAAGITLDNIKGSGLGAGQGFTDKDLKFLQDAKSFQITWNKENIDRVLQLQEKAAIEGSKRWNTRYSQIQKTATGPINVSPVEVPKPYSGQVKFLGVEGQ